MKLSGLELARGLCIGVIAAVAADGWRMYLLMVAVLAAFMLTDWIAEDEAEKRWAKYRNALLRRRS